MRAKEFFWRWLGVARGDQGWWQSWSSGVVKGRGLFYVYILIGKWWLVFYLPVIWDCRDRLRIKGLALA